MLCEMVYVINTNVVYLWLSANLFDNKFPLCVGMTKKVGREHAQPTLVIGLWFSD